MLVHQSAHCTIGVGCVANLTTQLSPKITTGLLYWLLTTLQLPAAARERGRTNGTPREYGQLPAAASAHVSVGASP